VSFSLIAQLVGNTLTLGCLYALVGMGFVVLFRATGVVNFAQGTFMVLGAYIFYTVVATAEQPFWIAFVIALAAIAALGAIVYLTMFYRLLGADLFVTVIATMGLSVVVQTMTFLIWGPQVRALPPVVSNSVIVTPFGVPLSPVDLVAIGTSLALIAALELTMQRTVLGIRMRAVADSPLLAALTRVNVTFVCALAWAISSLCAAVAGIAVTLRITAVDPVSLGQLGLLIFPVVILGGVDSLRGAMVGGLAVAAIQNLAVVWLGGNWVNAAAYAVLLLMLLLRPRGLFGSRVVARI
jgi:branched-chain amino acid transport system permease protein